MILVLMAILMIANTLEASNDAGLKQAGEYAKYLVLVVGGSWLSTLAWRFLRSDFH